jgi:hypothetical protein
MNLIVTHEHRYDRTPDGVVWTQVQFAHSYWRRYLAVFDQVRVVTRVCDVPSVPPDWIRADGEGVSFAAVPYYIGLWQYLLRARLVTVIIAGLVVGCVLPNVWRDTFLSFLLLFISITVTLVMSTALLFDIWQGVKE